MRFGFIVPNIFSAAKTPLGLRTSARLAEAVGFASIWTSDHILMPRKHADYADGTEALTTLAYLAGVTQRVELGLSVLVLPMRNPLVAAKQIATLTFLAEREIIVGVGVGWAEQEFNFVNADFRRRGALTDEYIAIMRKLWADENPAHEGTYSFADAIFSPRPQAVPEIWVGGNSEAALQRAARLGDGFHPGAGNEPADFAALVARLREASNGRAVTASMSMRFDMRDGAQAVIDRLGAYREGGLQYPVLRLVHETAGDLFWQLEAFGRDVLPAFAEDN